MNRIICIAGLPGSGKTHLAMYLASYLDNCLVIDDIQNLDELPTVTNETIIITDPNFVFTEVRETAQGILTAKYGDWIEWMCFENDPEKCLVNVRHRNDGRDVERFIRQYTKIYCPVNAIPIWQPS